MTIPESQENIAPPPAEENLSGESAHIPWKPIALLGVLTLIIIAAISAYGGYRSGTYQTQSAQSTLVSQNVQAQYTLALADIEAKRYDLARQRLEYIIQQDPNFPGVTDTLAGVIMQMSITASPTPAPTPTLTPTPDLRSVEELFTQSEQLMMAGDWSGAYDALLKLRKDAPDYFPVEVDGRMYVVLRNRGIEKIQKSDLEGGIYDLALAERFGPLDGEAQNWRNWAEFYITGASFWEVDWIQVIDYFSQLAPAVPNLMDASGWTATDRLRIAHVKYGDQLALAEEWCKALEQYQLANEVGPNPTLEATQTYADEQCGGNEDGGGKKKTKTPEGGAPEETPTPESGGSQGF